MKTLRESGVEFRRGLSGGGNQLRQPFLRDHVPTRFHDRFPKVEHVHSYGFYIGNYPDLPQQKIVELCQLLNGIE
jgi:CDP-6-deoxy-D-xylo-4-hexulose-3-dehydrase